MKAIRKNCPKQKPLALMFWYGAEEHELAQCFKDSRVKLIRARAKAQNLPKSHEQALDLLLSLTDEAMFIVRKWFREKANFELECQPEAALEIFKSLPLSKIDSEALKGEWRSLLSLFSQDSIPQTLGDFLQVRESLKTNAESPVKTESTKKPIQEKPDKVKEKQNESAIKRGIEKVKGKVKVKVKQRDNESDRKKENQKEQEGFIVTRKMLQEYLKSINEKRETSEDNLIGSLLDGAIAATKGDQAAYQKAKAEIAKSSGELGPDLHAVMSKFESIAGRNGLRLRKALGHKSANSLDPELYPAVAEVRKILPTGQFFANVIGMMVDEDLLELSPGDARSVYPLGGEILAFPNTIPGNHHEGELAIWRTERHATDKKNKFIITTLHARLYDVTPVPYPSSDPDGLRGWLIGSYQNTKANLSIFELSDGLLVRLPGDPKDTKLYKFENPLDLYESLDAIELSNGRRLVVSPLPAAPQKLDCAPPIISIKRLLKIQKTSEQFPTFSRAQVDALSEFIKAEREYPITPSMARATERLAAISVLREQLDEVVVDMLSLPTVSQRIEQEKKSLLQKYADEQTEYQKLLKNLKDEKSKLDREILAAKKSIKAQEQELASQIRERFVKAQSEGIETLSQVALFAGLIGDSQISDMRLSKEAQHTRSRIASIEIGAELDSLNALKLALARASYSSGQSAQLLSAVISSALTCGAVGLVGEKKDVIVRTLSTILAGGVQCSVSISVDMFSISDLLKSPALVEAGGHTVGMAFGEFIDLQSSLGRTSVVELVGANRMPPESYLPELMNKLKPAVVPSSVAWTGPGGKIKTTNFNSPIILILNFFSGSSTFPLTSTLSTQVPFVAVDPRWGDEPPEDNSVTVKPSHLLATACSELVHNLPLRVTDPIGSSSGASDRLSITLKNMGCQDAGDLAKALLQAGRLGSSLNSPDGRSSSASFIQKIYEAMHLCSHSLFTQSIDEDKRG